MSTTVSEVLGKVAIDLQEDSSFSSGLWNVSEMISYVNYAEVDFLRRTGILKIDASLIVGGVNLWYSAFFGHAQFIATGPPNATPVVISTQFNKPASAMDIERLSWNGKMLYRVTSWDLSRENPDWRNQSPTSPKYYHEDNVDLNTFEVDNLPDPQYGTFRVFADFLPPPHSATTESMWIPDPWIQYIVWLVDSLALAKDGDGQDLARSQYAQQRYLFGVNLAIRLMRGSLDQSVEAVSNVG